MYWVSTRTCCCRQRPSFASTELELPDHCWQNLLSLRVACIGIMELCLFSVDHGYHCQGILQGPGWRVFILELSYGNSIFGNTEL
ncbi:hypothetical protein WG66_011196 [Moniliophthora roreri]|nr:hypothetical protein WG66_011196 [Moniliophthora roreri]